MFQIFFAVSCRILDFVADVYSEQGNVKTPCKDFGDNTVNFNEENLYEKRKEVENYGNN